MTMMTASPNGLALQTLTLLIHAGSKIGKTTLSATAPLPILVLDAEGGWKWIASSPTIVEMYGRPLLVRYWDPLREAIPQYDGSWEICIVTVRDWATVQRAYDWVVQAPHQFVTFVMDSVTEIQRRCKDNLVGTEAMKQGDWGVLLVYMDAVIRGFRDLANNPNSPIRCSIFIAETREKTGKWRPYMQGQIEVSLPYWMDIVGYLTTIPIVDANGQPSGQLARRLLITPIDPMYEAGERVQGKLGTYVDFPNVSSMIHQVYAS